MASTTLSLFWNLSSNSEEDRLDASVKLISALETFQAKHTPSPASGESSNDEAEDEEEGALQRKATKDNLDANNAPDVVYSIRRLIRGLASPRESSRLGFAVALTELLSRINSVSCSQVLSLITDASMSQGSMSGQEERDALFARLFGLTSVLQSGLLLRSSSSSSSDVPADLSSFEEWLMDILAVGMKKSWLRESAGWTLLSAVSALAEAAVPWREDAKTLLVRQIFIEDKVWTPEKVAILLKCQDEWKGMEWSDVTKGAWKHGNVLHSSNYGALARVLKESEADDADESKKLSTGTWKPQLHFVWDILLDCILPISATASTHKAGSVQEFFRIVVDESLFSSTSSAERKYHGFQVFSKALARADEATVPFLFTPNLMRCFINHLASADRYLHRIARSVATEIQAVVQKTPSLGMALVAQLTGEHGSKQFDRLTRTKTVESILGAMDAAGISTYVHHLLAQVNSSSEEEDTARNARRSWIVDQLSGLIRTSAVPKSDNWVTEVLDFLTLHGLFTVKKKSEKNASALIRSPAKPTFTDELQMACRTKLLSCLADLIGTTTTTKTEDGKTVKATGTAADGQLWVSKVLASVERFENDPKHIVVVSVVDEEERALRMKARDVITGLKTVAEDHRSEAHGVELLLAASLLQRYCAMDADDLDDSLEAVTGAASRMFVAAPAKKSKKARKSTDAEQDPDAPPALDTLVDVIIGFLEESTAYMRTVANQVFASLSTAVKQQETLGLILTQLDRRDPAEDGEEMDVDGDEEEQADGVDDSPEHAPSSDEDGNSEEEDEEENEELRQKLEDALGKQAPDGEESDDSDDLMDDDQMMAIDEQLAMIFKSRSKDSKASTDAQRKATHFKNRVLDLVDIFLKTRAGSPLAIDCMLPLIDLITGTGADEKQLADKASGILRSRFGKSKEVPTGVDKEQTVTVLEEIHSRSRRASNQDVLATLSQCSLYLTRVLLGAAKDAVIATYKKSLEDFATRKASSFNGNFFQDFAKRYPAQAWDLRSDAVELASRSVNAYRKCQVFQVVHVLLSQASTIDGFDEQFVKFIPSLRDALLATLTPTGQDASLNAAQAKELLKLASQAVRQSKRVTASSLSTLWKPDAWEELRSQLASSDRFKASTGLLNACKQIVELTSGSSSAKVVSDSAKPVSSKVAEKKAAKLGKRKADDSGAKQVEGKTKTKKVKKT